jgi:hypothetical protein
MGLFLFSIHSIEAELLRAVSCHVRFELLLNLSAILPLNEGAWSAYLTPCWGMEELLHDLVAEDDGMPCSA